MPRPADPNAKAALVLAARAEFARKGLRGARVEDITAACGLSKGAFYLHYPSKESLFEELVSAFVLSMAEESQKRHAAMQALIDEWGPLTREDMLDQSAKYRQTLAMEADCDLRTLEKMWDFRDVLGTLISGCQGTRFEGAIWEVTDREVARVAEMFRTFQAQGGCRQDIPPELFGSLIVGTYTLLGQRMSRATEKPDLAGWARTLHQLIREGSSPLPRAVPERTVRPQRQSKPAKAKKPQKLPSSRRSSSLRRRS